MPRRIQRKRTKGWEMPEDAVYVGRPGRWGNPFNLSRPEHCWTALAHGFRADRAGRIRASVAIYHAWLLNGKPDGVDCGFFADDGEASHEIASSPAIDAPAPPSIDEIRRELAGKDLACWCPLDQPCHADVLLELANRPAPVSGEGE